MCRTQRPTWAWRKSTSLHYPSSHTSAAGFHSLDASQQLSPIHSSGARVEVFFRTRHLVELSVDLHHAVVMERRQLGQYYDYSQLQTFACRSSRENSNQFMCGHCVPQSLLRDRRSHAANQRGHSMRRYVNPNPLFLLGVLHVVRHRYRTTYFFITVSIAGQPVV